MDKRSRPAAGGAPRCAPDTYEGDCTLDYANQEQGGVMLQGLTSDYQLTLPTILQRAETLYGNKEIVTRRPDKSFHRYTYADFVSRSKKLAVALKDLGLEDGDRVGTLCWNT